MLQVKHLVKHYTTKGETVKALDDVSVDFPEKGMVFLLGKSGSGKSTLLNVSGGLDEPDEGEVIVNGKSSKDFSKSDFDSYRNTYLGFIFQEYNILQELTVAENVALAIELQGKPNDPEKVGEILRRVDLEGLGGRRPNTLSGGQKQRVAIARALVKDPEIIMGDEPTGALDSKTGMQVFDTLKKLAEEKLVVIVSHDREFAEVYADRIIELKDGKIVSDVTRTAEERETARKNFEEVAEKKIALRSGAAMTDDEARRMVEFVKRHKGSVVVSAEEEDVERLPRAPHATFEPTEVTDLPVPPPDGTEFIKSKFPFRYAFKMGVSGLRLKPLRLIFTTLLATIAFIVFGVFSTLITYDAYKIGKKSLVGSDYGAAVIEKHGVMYVENSKGKVVASDINTGASRAHFSDAEIARIREKYGETFLPVFNFNLASILFTGYQSRGLNELSDAYYEAIEEFTGFVLLSEAQRLFDNGSFTLIAGEMPQAANEMLVSQAVYETFAHYGYNRTSPAPVISSPDDLVGQEINLSMSASVSIPFYITGVYDPHETFEEHESLKGQSSAGLSGAPLNEYKESVKEFAEVFRYSMSSLAVVGNDCWTEYGKYDTFMSGENVRFANVDGTRFRSSNFVESFGMGPWQRFIVKEEAEPAGSHVQFLFAPLTGGRSTTASAVMAADRADWEEMGVDYRTPYAFMRDIRANESVFGDIIVILGPAAAVLAVFSALLLFNFISASINAKRKDIGILRAVGARGIDVYKIFMVEGAAITLFCFALGALGALLVCSLINPVLISAGLLSFGMFYFDWVNALVVLAVAGATAIVSTAVPVALTVKKKPVEAIRAI